MMSSHRISQVLAVLIIIVCTVMITLPGSFPEDSYDAHSRFMGIQPLKRSMDNLESIRDETSATMDSTAQISVELPRDHIDSSTLPISISVGNLTLNVLEYRDCELLYSVSQAGVPIIEGSQATECPDDVQVVVGLLEHLKDSWIQVGAEQKSVHTSKFTNLKVDVGSNQLIEFRLYGHAIAVRSIVSGDGGLSVVSNIKTGGFKSAVLDMGNEKSFLYIDNLKDLDIVSTNAQWGRTSQQLPFLFESTKVVHISEACNLGEFSNARASISDTALTLSFVREENHIFQNLVTTPWILMHVAESHSDLVNSALHPGCLCSDPTDSFEWVKPGKVLRDVIVDTQSLATLCDQASLGGYEYVLIDAGWYGNEYSEDSDPFIPIIQMKGANYSLTDSIKSCREKSDTGIILYVNDIAFLKYDTLALFDTLVSWGVRGIKFGFVDVSSSLGMQRILSLVKECAKRKLVVNIHDNFREYGLSRTLPNLLSTEGVHGDEHDPVSSEHLLTIPFTRGLAGRTDFTFTFDYSRLAKSHKSPVLQLAAPILIPNGLLHLYWYRDVWAIKSRKLYNSPFEVWTELPGEGYERSQVIEGVLGRYILVARKAKNSNTWFVVMANAGHKRVFKVDMQRFDLEKSSKWTMLVYTDTVGYQSKLASLGNYDIPEVDILKLDVSRKDSFEYTVGTGEAVILHITKE